MTKKKCYSYKHLPNEVTNYAGDQAMDRNLRGIDFDYKKQLGCFTNLNIKEDFEGILGEKIHDVLWEVRHGERTDFDRGFLENLDVSGASSNTGEIK